MERRLAAVFAADVVGYSRLMGVDEVGTLERLKALRKDLVQTTIASRKGRIVKLMGDGLLAEFPSVVEAVQCAVDIQTAMANRDQDLPEDQRIRLRIGVNLGDIIVEGSDIYGDGINIASRLEALAEPGGVCISSMVHDNIRTLAELEFTDAGEHTVKNIERPIHVFTWPVSDRRPPTASKLPLPDKPSVVVLPFDNLSNDPEQEYFADGMVEAITAALANIKSFFVIARNSAFAYKGKTFDIRTVGRDLGVGYALEGSVQRAGNTVRVTTQLIETLDGAHVWAQKFDGSLDDIFELQDTITEQVAGAIQPSIRLAEIRRTRRKRPHDYGAYDFTMQALPHCWHLEDKETVLALGHLENALSVDETYPLALSLAAWCHAQRAVYNWTDDVEAAKAEALALAEKAADQSDDDPLVLTILGTAHSIVRNDKIARNLLERAVSIDANAAFTWGRLGWLETYEDNWDLAIQHFEKARRLSPLDPLTFNILAGTASAYHGAGRLERAVEFFDKALDERPQASWIYRQLAACLVDAGQIERAEQAFSALTKAYPGLTEQKIRNAMVLSDTYMDRLVDSLKQLGLPG